jgi:hypothetical protein
LIFIVLIRDVVFGLPRVYSNQKRAVFKGAPEVGSDVPADADYVNRLPGEIATIQ